MVVDYGCFGDVVTFDITYRTNNVYGPPALFLGLNHLRGVIIFGAAFLYDEMVESFKWLFETFCKYTGNRSLKLFYKSRSCNG